VTYFSFDKVGSVIEEKISGLNIKNKVAGSFLENSAAIVPNSFDAETVNRYTVQF